MVILSFKKKVCSGCGCLLKGFAEKDTTYFCDKCYSLLLFEAESRQT